MPFSDRSYDPDTLTALKDAFDMAWEELKLVPGLNPSDDLRNELAIQLMEVADRGRSTPSNLGTRWFASSRRVRMRSHRKARMRPSMLHPCTRRND